MEASVYRSGSHSESTVPGQWLAVSQRTSQDGEEATEVRTSEAIQWPGRRQPGRKEGWVLGGVRVERDAGAELKGVSNQEQNWV